ncbi:hypothetical protein WN944_019396 [Citrus x changshan-huyou]|uniref:Uncharacterized protein n=1 Tax=Citrus x changshan-huyou TaxID=2935761 RepID=A0AAP0QDZ4_9ROSI
MQQAMKQCWGKGNLNEMNWEEKCDMIFPHEELGQNSLLQFLVLGSRFHNLQSLVRSGSASCFPRSSPQVDVREEMMAAVVKMMMMIL